MVAGRREEEGRRGEEKGPEHKGSKKDRKQDGKRLRWRRERTAPRSREIKCEG